MNDTVKETVEKIEANTKTTMEKGTALVRDVVEFQKGNLEAAVESGKLAVKGAQSLGQNAFEISKKNFSASSEQLKKLVAVRSPVDFFKLQTEFVRSQFNEAVADTKSSGELFVKLAGETIKPLQGRYTVAAEKIKSLAA